MIEKWLPVVGFEGLYEVSDLGRVKSVERRVLDKRGHTKYVRERILAAAPDTHGYPRLLLWRANRKYGFQVYILVARAFLGPCPVGQQACHWDGKPTNSRLENLRYDTPKGNKADDIRNGTRLFGERNPLAKLTAEDVREIRQVGEGRSLREHAEIYGV